MATPTGCCCLYRTHFTRMPHASDIVDAPLAVRPNRYGHPMQWYVVAKALLCSNVCLFPRYQCSLLLWICCLCALAVHKSPAKLCCLSRSRHTNTRTRARARYPIAFTLHTVTSTPKCCYERARLFVCLCVCCEWSICRWRVRVKIGSHQTAGKQQHWQQPVSQSVSVVWGYRAAAA